MRFKHDPLVACAAAQNSPSPLPALGLMRRRGHIERFGQLVPPTDGETKPPRPANCSAATQASQTRSSGLQRMRLWAWALRGHWALLGPKRLTTPLLLAAPQFQRFLTASGRGLAANLGISFSVIPCSSAERPRKGYDPQISSCEQTPAAHTSALRPS